MKKPILGLALVAAFISAGVLSFQPRPTAPGTEQRGPEAAAILIPSLVVAPARADDTDDVVDGLKKIKDQSDCRSRCNSASLSCMSQCANGHPGASCRANCVMESNNCSQGCN